MRQLKYLDFLRDDEIQSALQIVANSSSQFMKDLERIDVRSRPLFMKLIFREEGNTWSYQKNLKIDKKEETLSEYQTRSIIARWIQKTWKFVFATAAVPAKIWKTSIPRFLDPRYNVLVFPEGEFYSMITFGVKDIIEKENGKSQEEIFQDLDLMKKEKKIEKGRYTINRIKNLDTGDMVFFVSQSITTIACTSRESFIYLRQQLYGEIPATDLN